ncbi:Hypothetical predicted protein [Mytilus galloprovincialis]|uniref:SUEL-type lectin domain-containing protein n=1 Tax=Mytilus galloprovincialis TaxID=29158 RepID=A0A8B6CG91_MYTGA|nr:Hypothetical predicted protein [Mytilus galloprovincialis]
MQMTFFAGFFVLAVFVTHVNGCGFIVCENKSAYIKCPYPLTISVRSAIYGRSTDSSVCPGKVKTTHCRSSRSNSKVKAQCNGKRICLLKPTNRQYGDPCRGTYKYLEVEYKCIYGLRNIFFVARR